MLGGEVGRWVDLDLEKGVDFYMGRGGEDISRLRLLVGVESAPYLELRWSEAGNDIFE